MTTLILISFLAGILTVLAPCVLPILPVILGGGLAGTNTKRPYIIIGSLILSLMIFTFILKVSTVFIEISPRFWDYLSGGLLVVFGISLLFPKIWTWFVGVTGVESWSQNSLEQASHKDGIWGPIGIGAALGPVFTSCNPTYALLLATILPLDPISGMFGLLAYFVGLGLILLLVTIFGRKVFGRFSFFVNPNGIFRRFLGFIILLVGLLISFGTIKNIQTWLVERGNTGIFADFEEFINDKIDTSSLRPAMCAGGKCHSDTPEVPVDFFAAPELVGIKEWINSDSLTLESLRGKVVLIDFWTYSCINCQRTQPYLNSWYEKYSGDGFIIIGVHAPEFSFEKLPRNVSEAVLREGIKYPVALDNDFKTWNAYNNRYWPAKYLIDQKGNIIYKHFGEGAYAETEKKIAELLGKNIQPIKVETENSAISQELTPETYLGSARAKNMVFERGEFKDGTSEFTSSALNQTGQWTLHGRWGVKSEYIESIPTNGSVAENTLMLHFAAKKAFLVVSLPEGKKGTLFIESHIPITGEVLTKTITVDHDDLYTVFESDVFRDAATVIIKPSIGLRLHAFTFGK